MAFPTHWECASCGARVDIATNFPFACPNATMSDRRHVLQRRGEPSEWPVEALPAGMSTLSIFDDRLAWAAHAQANGLDAAARRRLIDDLDVAVTNVDGRGFAPTPYGRSDELSDRLGFDGDGGIWVKDETVAVAGSQKARHLVTILLHLLAVEHIGAMSSRPRLAISSCGNAALAAATLARAADWPIDVYVPTWMGEGFGRRLDELGATIHPCDRRAGDLPGDPAMFRFRDAVAAGAIPFTVQGPENALCLDGGRTLGWEIAAQHARGDWATLDRIVIQVGGGAFAASVGAALPIPLMAVQAAGCAPLQRAWQRAGHTADLAPRWSELMTVWDHPHSVADGILDDETYDWLGVVEAMRRNGGGPIVAAEEHIVAAHRLAQEVGFDASPTGTAGLAGVLALRHEIGNSERIAVVMSGVAR